MLIVTIAPDSDLTALDRIVEMRRQQPTLFVLPKWQTIPLPAHEGWETRLERLSRDVVDRRLNRIAAPSLGTEQSKATRVIIAGYEVTVPARAAMGQDGAAGDRGRARPRRADQGQ